ncbi:MxaD protein [Rhodoblastus sphagnicola]|uniref:MxaD protein n=1 Tax=Rhodoblastus sphagnicola TaxID=333368 RepID=A0A2S6NED0_9HYPH|nr:SRPBCC family protein [Rhodoblastus sphagnicola]MBB4200164.1 mxaD protein [Rhodoblastus sphagnicola]PPQ32992.1 MxaD protein [Rhodoblastus sphagnicola]
MKPFWIMTALCVCAPALAHGPTPIKVDESIVIAADPKAVWALAGPIDSLSVWHPDVAAVKTSGGPGNGAEREIVLKAGGVIKEGVDEYDGAGMKYSYRMYDPNLDALPVSSYSATFSVTPAPDGGSEAHWRGRLYRGDTSNEPPENLDDDAARGAITAFFRHGLDNLKKKAEAR